MAVGTGHGTTISTASPDLNLNHPVQSMDLHQESSDQVDVSNLTSGPTRDYVPADLVDLDEFSVVIYFDTELVMPTRNTKATITITFKITNPANSTPATLVGIGWIRSRKWPNLETNTPMTGPLTIQWETDPVLTPEAV